MLQDRLNSVEELERSKGDGRSLITQISSQSNQLRERLPPRAKETIERDIANMK